MATSISWNGNYDELAFTSLYRISFLLLKSLAERKFKGEGGVLKWCDLRKLDRLFPKFVFNLRLKYDDTRSEEVYNLS